MARQKRPRGENIDDNSAVKSVETSDDATSQNELEDSSMKQESDVADIVQKAKAFVKKYWPVVAVVGVAFIALAIVAIC